jgi:hypothetical protein
MEKREIPAQVVWAVVALVVIIAVYFVWNAGAPNRVQGGNPTAKDREILKQMQEARQKSGAGRAMPATGQAQPPSPGSPP